MVTFHRDATEGGKLGESSAKSMMHPTRKATTAKSTGLQDERQQSNITDRISNGYPPSPSKSNIRIIFQSYISITIYKVITASSASASVHSNFVFPHAWRELGVSTKRLGDVHRPHLHIECKNLRALRAHVAESDGLFRPHFTASAHTGSKAGHKTDRLIPN